MYVAHCLLCKHVDPFQFKPPAAAAAPFCGVDERCEHSHRRRRHLGMGRPHTACHWSAPGTWQRIPSGGPGTLAAAGGFVDSEVELGSQSGDVGGFSICGTFLYFYVF